MTDSTTPNGTNDDETAGLGSEARNDSDTEQTTGSQSADTEQRTGEPREPNPDRPGAQGNDQPMSESTDGGLDGGDPGVEE
ncbi:hypothetical protein ABIQ69_03025 [Agromyces sp. G08B096]|uniref:Uncharacterized protein n=1 Tax=Agromyces sp. G08B096 TaxID=3156399 RepID=A0AAU7W8W9_9MICO